MKNIISSTSTQDFAYNLLVFILFLIIMTFVLKYLWNAILVKYISVLRPIPGSGPRSYIDVFLLAFAIAIFKL